MLIAALDGVPHLNGGSGRGVDQFKQFIGRHWLFGPELLGAVFPQQNKREFILVNIVVIVHPAEGARVVEDGYPDVTLNNTGRIGSKPLALEFEVGIGCVTCKEQHPPNALSVGLN